MADADSGASPREGDAPTGRSGLGRFRYEYGAQPLHLIAVVASLLLSGYGLLRLNDIDDTVRILVWLVAAALLHDLLALPLYSLLLRIAHTAAGRAIESKALMLHALNHIRVPVALSLLLLLVYFPLILRVVPDEYLATTGLTPDAYLSRWLLISAAMFVISGIAYAIRLRGGVAEPGTMVRPAAEHESVSPPGMLWRIGTRLVLAATALAILWVAAALIVGLLSTGPGG